MSSKIRLSLMGALVSCCLMALGCKPDSGTSQLRFNSSEWQEPEATTDGRRLQMYNDLISSYELVGQSQKYIITLLGEPDEVIATQGLVIWEYRLGPEGGAFGIDSVWLQTSFDQTTLTVVSISKVTD